MSFLINDDNDWTYGAELEYGNVLATQPLIHGTWNRKDNSVVSTTGIANDPQAKLYEYGGEINTSPTKTIAEQVSNFMALTTSLNPKPVVNYRSNLHIHIRVPGLKDDLLSLKKLLMAVHTNMPAILRRIEEIPYPYLHEFNNEYEHSWAMKRYNRRKKSHQHLLSHEQIRRMMTATNPETFYLNEAHLDAKGNRAWFQCPRACVNIRQIFEETETIEFRHFPGTLNHNEFYAALLWCHLFLDRVFSDENPYDILDEYDFKSNLPKFADYEFETEQVYQYTNFDKNSRTVVSERLGLLRDMIDIDDLNTSSKDVYKVIKGIEGFKEVASVGMLPL